MYGKKIGLLRNKKCNINWNEWKDKDRNAELKEEMEKIGRDWVMEKELITPDMNNGARKI